MACVLPFNCIKVDGVAIAGPADFEYGSGQLTLNGEDSAIVTADGRIHNYRVAITPSSTANLRGDKRSSETGYVAGSGQSWPTLAGTIGLYLMSSLSDAAPTLIRSFAGIISGEYDTQNNRTTLNIQGDTTSY
jgi:hypothetical protein